MNKKGISGIGLIIIGFAFMAVSYFFLALFVFDVGNTYLINPVGDIGLDIISENTVASVNNSVSATIINLKTEYSNFNFPFDLSFFMIAILSFIGTLYLSNQAAKSGYFEFMGLLFIGTMFILVITTYASDFISWFLTNFYENLFNTSLASTPFFYWYVSNLGLVNFIWWIIVLLVNILDFSIIRSSGRVEE